ncbi:hypothetical protein HS1genome_0811 [Sulfodiicoccus acidiphilus]|uniref:CopG family transcriptional regulator n=1 Tax=Sulfodiicoccus acidiphilus TaxID=1670455 RepID=A0A348B2M0_9CREN|nr:hypothetical protein [Sulfodiicoccus acidiphilus]BBD72422.1 hypothetical protein HS1genome_0811 [Sulfodiicoccus acidiphilus]GGT97242.1 hypothetical protein GCM10007116_13450 [Sulfodiicoccus acidiphilus]
MPRRKKGTKKDRCNTWVECEIYERLKELSRRRGSSVYNYINELVETSIELEDRGVTASAAGEVLIAWNLLKAAGLIVSPILGGSLNEWKGAGVRLGTLIKHNSLDVNMAIKVFSMIMECLGHVEVQGDRVIVAGIRSNEDTIKSTVEMINAASSTAGIKLEVKYENGVVLLERKE